MICYVLAMGKQHVGPHVVVGYGIKIFWPGLFITSPDHLEWFLNTFKYRTKLVQAFAIQPVRHESGIFRFVIPASPRS